NRFGEFAHVAGDIAQIVDNFVNVFLIGGHEVVDAGGQLVGLGQSPPQLVDSVFDSFAVIANHGIQVGDEFVGLGGGGLEIIEQRDQFRAGYVNVINRGMNRIAIIAKNAVDVFEAARDIGAVFIVKQIVDAAESFLGFDDAVVQVGDKRLRGGSETVDHV